MKKFGHHPEPATDFCVEVEAIEAEIIDTAAGLPETMDLSARIARAMEFKAGGSAQCVAAKADLREFDISIRAARSRPHTPRSSPPTSNLEVAGGWKEAAIAWEVCASIHREYAKGKDALFTTRQADYVRDAEDARQKAMPALYAAPVAAPAAQAPENRQAEAEKDRLAALESALQFADYLTTSAAYLLGAIAHEDTLLNIRISPALSDAIEARVDCCTKVERNIYEYRKRRRLTDRADYRAPETRES